MPVSRTVTDDLDPLCTRATSSMRPPGSVYLALLFSRFQKTWASRVRSASR